MKTLRLTIWCVLPQLYALPAFGQEVTPTATRSSIPDWIILGLLVSGVLFAICRTSRRT
ncbi:hypothetical protein [Calycomorphotria hydatis]|nr:hypothetical protein [Calycomorphotria hydatis]